MSFKRPKKCPCGQWFSGTNSSVYCEICNTARNTASNYGPKWRLVHCDDMNDEGMLGRLNSIAIWKQLRVVGAVIVNDGKYMTAVDGIHFQECKYNPAIPAKSSQDYTSGTGYHARRSDGLQITAGGFA